MKKILSLLVALVLALGCAAMAEVAFVDEGYNYEIAENAEGKEVRIAVLMVNNNPFWVDVENGAKDIQETMKKYNCTVDIQTIEDFDGQAFSDAIDNCIIMEYDGICTVGVSDAIIPAIERATAAGIRVYTFNSDTSEECSRVAFHGQSLYGAGELAGETLAQLIGGEGKVAIITGLFSVPAHELRRTGGLASFAKYEGIEVVGETECHDSGDEAYTQVMDFLTANPDLNAVVCLDSSAATIGTASFVDERGLEDQWLTIGIDASADILNYVKSGALDATMNQDFYAMGYNSVKMAYEKIVNGTEPTFVNDTGTYLIMPADVDQYAADNNIDLG